MSSAMAGRSSQFLKHRNLMTLKDAFRTLDKKISQVELLTQKGLLRAALLIKRDAMKNCPIRTGNLRASAYIISKGESSIQQENKFKGDDAQKMQQEHNMFVIDRRVGSISRKGPYAEVGFTAHYALWVHEDPNAGTGTGKGSAAYKTKSSVGGPKFLERAVRQNMSKVFDIVASEGKKAIKSGRIK